MPKEKPKFSLSDIDKKALVDMAYGENASEDTDTLRMTMGSAINRLRSGRGGEFGKTMSEVLRKPNAYYAVSDNAPLYQEAITGKFPSVSSKAKYGLIKKQLDIMLENQDFGNAMFYFRPEEEEKLRKGRISKKTGKRIYDFNFNAVKPTGKIGVYNTYGYGNLPARKINAAVSQPNINFKNVFAAARKQGLNEFEYQGKKYNTRLK